MPQFKVKRSLEWVKKENQVIPLVVVYDSVLKSQYDIGTSWKIQGLKQNLEDVIWR